MDRHGDHGTRLQAPRISVSVASRPTLDLEECRPLEGSGIHHDLPLGKSEALGRDSQLVSDQRDVCTQVDGTT